MPTKVINIGDVARPAGYFKFKTRAVPGRNESPVANSPAFNAAGTVVPNSYTLTSRAAVSSGVYKTDGTLVRTLESAEVKEPGTYPIKWDGTDDDLNVLPVTDYTVKVVSNDIQVKWQGVAGNTSTSLVRQEIYSSLDAPTRMVIVGTRAYYLVGYNEGQASVAAFDLNNIQVRKDSFNRAGGIVESVEMATDGTYIYLATFDGYHPENSFVYARKISDGTTANFSGGTPYTNDRQFSVSALDYRNTSWKPTGLTLSASYIFVAYKENNIIAVLNKSTGAKVLEISINKPGALAVDGANIWITSNDTIIQKYPLNSNGSIGGLLTSITGLSGVVDMKVNGGLLGVIDGGTSQQVKAFNTSNGSIAWTLGQPGGVLNSPLVTNDRFGFWIIKGDAVKHNRGGIEFQSDGSFWIIDATNGRMQHYSSNRVLIESIMYMQHVRTCALVGNDNKRLLGNGLEFAITYTNANAVGWSLKYNWEGKLINFVTEEWIKYVNNLSNGKTYGLVQKTTGNPYQNGGSGLQVVELNPSTGLRYTKVWIAINYLTGVRMYPDGSIYGLDNNGTLEKWVKMSLQSFDADGDPVYTTSTLPVTLAIQPGGIRLSGPYPAPYEVTASNILVLYKGDFDPGEDGKPHLGGIDATTGKVMFKTMYSTFEQYVGDLPQNGFDVGNGAGMATTGSAGLAYDRLIISGYPAEGYKHGQANIFNIYLDNGLYLGQFGVNGNDFEQDPVNFPGMAGNAYLIQLTKEGADYYLYHGDESVKGGVHRWKIANAASIQEQLVPISSSFVRSTEKVLPAGVIDLMAGLPRKSTISGTSANWTITPKTTSDYIWQAKTSVLSYDKRSTPDIDMYYNGVTVQSVTRPINGGSNLNAWELTGKIAYNGENPNYWNASGPNAFFDVLDNAGKIIVRVHQISDVPHLNTIFKANNATLFTKETAAMQTFTRPLRGLSILKNGGVITVVYDDFSAPVNSVFEAGANMANPTTVRIYFNNGDGASGVKNITIDGFKFSPFSSQAN